MDENPSDMSPETAPKPTKAKVAATAPAKKAAKKTKKRAAKTVAKSVEKPVRKELPQATPVAIIAVYVILALGVIFTSGYVGYLIGKGDMTQTVQTGAQGELVLIEYSDFECPFCSRALPTIQQIKQQYGDKVTLEYKHYPLESIHPNAMQAAIASECAEDQGKFWEYHDLLFANQEALSVADLKRYAQQLNLNQGKFDDCLDNKKTESRVRADMQEAQSKGVSGTPSFWVKDELIVGAQPFSVFQQKIDEKLSGKAAPTVPSAPQAPTPPAKVDVVAGANVKGDANAKVTIVEFTDYQCPFCKRFFDETEGQIIKNYVDTGKVRYAVRHFPLPFHQNAQKASEAAECAAQQGKFWEMHNLLFAKGQADGTGLAVADLKQYAADLKLDTGKFNTCLDTGAMTQKVQSDMQDGQAAGVSGTPSFVINGQLVVGAQPYSSFQSAIEAALN